MTADDFRDYMLSFLFWRNLISSVILIFIESLPDILVLLVKLILSDGFLFFYSFVTYVLSPNKKPPHIAKEMEPWYDLSLSTGERNQTYDTWYYYLSHYCYCCRQWFSPRLCVHHRTPGRVGPSFSNMLIISRYGPGRQIAYFPRFMKTTQIGRASCRERV